MRKKNVPLRELETMLPRIVDVVFILLLQKAFRRRWFHHGGKIRILARGGAGNNPPNRFEKIHEQRDEDWHPAEDPSPKTQFLRDLSQSIISYNDSPDIPFKASLNCFRGCEHGCSYCYARNTHEYLGFSAGQDFETKIMVKENAPELLGRELSSPKWKPQTLAMSGVTDCYQPIERRLQLTRRCLAVLAEFRNPVRIITKNYLVTRDIDLLQELAQVRQFGDAGKGG
jgi:hypothetical protein